MIENSWSKLPNPAFAGESLASIPMEQAIVIGSIARRVLDGVRFGRVAEIFERSLYLDVNGDWICLADMALGSGPLIVSVEGKYGRGWMHRFSVGRLVELTPASITIDDCPIISTQGVSSWLPPPPPIWSKTSLERGLDALANLTEARLPTEGLGRFLLACHNTFPATAESRAAVPSIEVLENWLHESFAALIPRSPDNESVAALLGLGPGLTPSGDDFLGGMLIALHVCGEIIVQKQLYIPIAALLETTGPVSRAHLQAAAIGEGSEALHRVFYALLKADVVKLASEVDAIDRIGHTSGWDALAGIATVLRAITSEV